MTQEDKLKEAKRLYQTANADQKYVLESLFPELEKGEEKIRKALIEGFNKLDKSAIWYNGITNGQILTWLEKQNSLMKCLQIANAKIGELIEKNYYLKEQLEKQSEHAKFLDSIQVGDKVTRNQDGVLVNLSQLKRVAKPAEKQGEQKPVDKVEPKFKVKYAGSEYNVFETKDIAGVTYYGIEDEPNHIDYVKAENCEIISGYAIKENASPYPTKPAVFSEQNPAWSEVDERNLYYWLDNNKSIGNDKYRWLLSLKDRVQPQPQQEWSEEDEEAINLACSILYSNFNENENFDKDQMCIGEIIEKLKSLKERFTWKPSDEQMKTLGIINITGSITEPHEGEVMISLYNDLKKLKG